VAGEILNYMFYPSQQGNQEIQLYENALIKMQGFHSALGEDAQIYSKEEVLHEFQLFDPKIKDKVDEQLAFLREVRELYNNDRTLYQKIKNLPIRSRVARHEVAVETGLTPSLKYTTITFIQSPRKTEYYIVTDDKIGAIDFISAAKILKASQDEKAADFAKIYERHFEHVNCALKTFMAERIAQQDSDNISDKQQDKTSLSADRFLRQYSMISEDSEIKQKISTLRVFIEKGTSNILTKEIKKMAGNFPDLKELRGNQYSLDMQINKLFKEYSSNKSGKTEIDNSDPNIVLSETFI
jgi:hypothetical protein